MNRFQQVAYLLNAQEALTQAQILYPGGQTDTKADAFRHAYFSYLNVMHLGYELAESLGTAHEEIALTQEEKTMDLHNNQMGRDAYLYHGGVSIYDYLEGLMNSGQLWIIVNGTVVPSNWTGN